MERIAIFGYAFGREVAILLAARGDDVVVAQGSAPHDLAPGCVFKACDVTRREAVASVCKDREIAFQRRRSSYRIDPGPGRRHGHLARLRHPARRSEDRHPRGAHERRRSRLILCSGPLPGLPPGTLTSGR
jgi:hypothetical protein